MTPAPLETKRFIKYWFAFFAMHLCWLFFSVAQVYFFRRFNPDGPSVFIDNEEFFFVSFVVGVMLFALAFVIKKTWRGFIVSSGLCLSISFLGVVVLFSIDTFYFLIFSILGLLGAGLQVVRYRRSLAPH